MDEPREERSDTRGGLSKTAFNLCPKSAANRRFPRCHPYASPPDPLPHPHDREFPLWYWPFLTNARGSHANWQCVPAGTATRDDDTPQRSLRPYATALKKGARFL